MKEADLLKWDKRNAINCYSAKKKNAEMIRVKSKERNTDLEQKGKQMKNLMTEHAEDIHSLHL